MSDVTRRGFMQLVLALGGYAATGRLPQAQPGQPPRSLIQFPERKKLEDLIEEVSGDNYTRAEGRVACMSCGEVVSEWRDMEFRFHVHGGRPVFVATHSCDFQFDETTVIDAVFVDTPYAWYEVPFVGGAKTINPGDTARIEVGDG